MKKIILCIAAFFATLLPLFAEAGVDDARVFQDLSIVHTFSEKQTNTLKMLDELIDLQDSFTWAEIEEWFVSEFWNSGKALKKKVDAALLAAKKSGKTAKIFKAIIPKITPVFTYEYCSISPTDFPKEAQKRYMLIIYIWAKTFYDTYETLDTSSKVALVERLSKYELSDTEKQMTEEEFCK